MATQAPAYGIPLD